MPELERRKAQRLKLSRPLLGTLNGQNTLILDLGMGGAFVEHSGVVAPGDRCVLTFKWRGEDIVYGCEVARTATVRERAAGRPAVSQSAVAFVKAAGEAEVRLQDMMATFVGHILAAQRANARGENGIDVTINALARIGDARRTRRHGFVMYRLADGEWTRTPVASTQQPVDGFTVGAHEDDDEIETLCRTYESADDESRRLIRLVAELSVRQAQQG